MRAREFIIESVTFSVNKLVDYGGTIGKEWSGTEFGKYQKQPCWGCNGTGKDHYDDNSKCELCNGSGELEDFVSDAPELNVSNSNAAAILDMLGLEFDYSGIVTHDKLQDLMTRLIKLKNSDKQQHTQEPTTNFGQRRTSVDPKTGLTTIGRGPTVHDSGRSHSQVERYVDTLMDMVKFAIKNDAALGWG